MFGKGHFEGDYRTKPVVNIRGFGKPESRDQLLERAHQDRIKREVEFCLLSSSSFVSVVSGLVIIRIYFGRDLKGIGNFE